MNLKVLALVSILILSIINLQAQESADNKTTTIGFELDAFPYISGGYYGSMWIGHNKMRYRGVIANVNTPDFILPDGFTNNEVQAYAAIADYFFQPGFKAWWIGAGLEYWKCTIQTDQQLSTGNYNQTIFTIGGGYVWKFYKNFYINPWVAAHARIGGETKVQVDGKEFNPANFIPEASLKIGWHF